MNNLIKKSVFTAPNNSNHWGLWSSIILGGMGVICFLIKQNAKTNQAIKYNNSIINNKIKLDIQKTINKCKIIKAKTDAKIRDRHDNTNEAARKRELYFEQNLKYGIGSINNINTKRSTQFEHCDWIKNFHSQHTMPSYKGIPLLEQILDACPNNYKDAMMLHMFTMLGAMCFSKVRAQYGEIVHSPSILTIIEGKQGSGKGKFNLVYKELFQRIIEQDKKKLADENLDRIIQTTGIHISASKFIDMLATNKGVHLYAMEQEISQIRVSSSPKRCLSWVDFRKAFDNDEADQNNKSRNSTQGRYPIYLNCTLTGTPNAINKIFNEEEVEGGTARRFCFTVIPELGAEPLDLHLPKGNALEAIRNLIDRWRNRYCFYHDLTKGDTPCPEHMTNLDYVVSSLKNWSKHQYKLYETDHINQRNELRNSMTTIAFRCAIILHMLLGEPDSDKTKERKTVKRFAVYIANYCMERYLTKFVPEYYRVSENEANTEQSTQKKRKLTLEEIEYWYPLRGTTGTDGKVIGYGSIAKHLGAGVSKDDVRNAFKKYERNMD